MGGKLQENPGNLVSYRLFELFRSNPEFSQNLHSNKPRLSLHNLSKNGISKFPKH